MNQTWARPSWQDAARAAEALWLWEVKFIVLNNKLPLNQPAETEHKTGQCSNLEWGPKELPAKETKLG